LERVWSPWKPARTTLRISQKAAKVGSKCVREEQSVCLRVRIIESGCRGGQRTTNRKRDEERLC